MHGWSDLIAQTNTDMPNWISLLIQLPVVAVFMLYTLKITKDYREDSKARDAAWMAFLDAERVQRRDSMKSGLDAMTAVTKTLGELSQAIVKQADSVQSLAQAVYNHDGKAMDRHNALVALLKQKAHKVQAEGDGA